jgi:hypothetical protein
MRGGGHPQRSSNVMCVACTAPVRLRVDPALSLHKQGQLHMIKGSANLMLAVCASTTGQTRHMHVNTTSIECVTRGYFKHQTTSPYGCWGLGVGP